MAELTDKQKAFVLEYLVDLNATQAAIRAGYSARTAEQQGSRLLRNVQVQEAIRQGQAERAERTQVTADRVVQELAALAFANMGDFLTIGADGTVQMDFTRLREADLRAVTKFTQRHIPAGEGPDIVETKFELGSKVQALTKLGEYLGMFKQKVEHSADDALSQLMREIDGRTRGIPGTEK